MRRGAFLSEGRPATFHPTTTGVPLEKRKVRVDEEAERLVSEGATRVRPVDQRGEYWMVMRDPEGNEFCLQ